MAGAVQQFRVGRALFWAATWGVGVAVGVALGGWLTVTGGAGAPGAGSLDVTEDLVVLPLLVGGVVFGVHLAGQFLVSRIRAIRASRERDSE